MTTGSMPLGRPHLAAPAWRERADLAAPLTVLFVFVMFFFPTLRGAPELYLLFLVTLSGLYVVYSGRMRLPRYALPLAAVAGLYILLSFAHALPKSWTVFFSASNVLRQSHQYFLVPLMAAAFYSCQRRLSADPRTETAIYLHLALAGLVFHAASLALSGSGPYSGFAGRALFEIYGFQNIPGLFQYLWISLVFLVLKTRTFRVLALAALLPALGAVANIAVQLFAISIAAWRPAPRLSLAFAIAFVVLLLGGMLLGVLFGFLPLSAIQEFDHNTWWRYLAWYDAANAFVDSQGMGIGFGSEEFRYAGALALFNTWADREQVMVTPLHNSFLQVFFRVGLPGGMLFIAMVASLWPRMSAHRDEVDRAAIAFFLLFVNFMVNPGFESPISSIFTAYLMAKLMHFRDRAT